MGRNLQVAKAACFVRATALSPVQLLMQHLRRDGSRGWNRNMTQGLDELDEGLPMWTKMTEIITAGYEANRDQDPCAMVHSEEGKTR